MLLGNKRLVTALLYRASEHGWEGKDFHDRCDEKKGTLCLFKIKDGDCIGGYTVAQWLSLSSDDDNHSGHDCDAMLFNLNSRRHFPSKRTGSDVWSHKEMGPCFMEGSGCELGVFEPFNGEDSCQSIAKLPGYQITVDINGVNMLTNKKNAKFTITELEVWQVTYT